jgi:hypothetical protein
MGVTKFYKMFCSVIDNVVTTEIKEPFGLMADLNGFIHKCAQQVFGYGNNLNNRPLDENIKLTIRDMLKTDKGTSKLKAEFLFLIPEILTKLIIERIRPTDFLILAVDGMAPFAKGKQQALRRTKAGMERCNSFDGIPSKEKFDTAHLTAGTEFMRDITKTIEEWIKKNSSRLPHYVLFSGSDVAGEGEHKIFLMLENLKHYMISNNTITTDKDLDSLFRSQEIYVYGTDADLCPLSMMRDYNFIWVREPYDIDKLNEGVKIDVVRDYVTNIMTKDFPPMTKENKYNIVDDFVILSFHIGDDFVPAMFPLTGNIKITLDTFMKVYNEIAIDDINNKRPFHPLSYGSEINISALTKLMSKLVKVEEEFYIKRQEVDKAEREGDLPKISKFRFDNKIKNVSNETYTPCMLLQFNYEDFCEKWKEVLRRPCLMSDRMPISNRINSLVTLSKEELDQNSDEACQDYITGIRWNFAYYKGKLMNNWFYKRSLPPTIKALSDFLNDGKYVMVPVERIPSDHIIQPTQMLSMILNPYFNNEVIMSVFKNDKNYLKAISNCKFLSANFPKIIGYIFQGKYKSEEHSKIPLLPDIIFEDVLKVIPLRNEFKKDNPIDWFVGDVTSGSWSRIIKSKINIARFNEVKVYEKEDTSENSNKLNNFINNSKPRNTMGGRSGGRQSNSTGRNSIRNPGRGSGRGRGRDQNDIINSMKVGRFTLIGVNKQKNNISDDYM